MENDIFHYGGVASAFQVFGNKIFEAMIPAKYFHQPTNETDIRSNPSLEW